MIFKTDIDREYAAVQTTEQFLIRGNTNFLIYSILANGSKYELEDMSSKKIFSSGPIMLSKFFMNRLFIDTSSIFLLLSILGN